MKSLPSRLLLFLILFCATSFARADEPSCNDLLSGLSVELKLSIQNLAQLRFDLDQQITIGTNDVVSRTLVNQFEEKLTEISLASGLSRDELQTLIRNEIQKIQDQDQIATDQKIKTKQIEAEESRQAATRFEYFGDLIEARKYHTQSLLPDGKVLIAGGFNHGTLSSIELIDPVTKKIEKFGDLLKARKSHAQSVLHDGKVLITGGSNDGNLSSIELIDPVTKKVEKFGDLLEPRSGHIQSVLPDGKVLVVGGYSGGVPRSSIELIDPVTKKVEKIGKLHERRGNHTQSVLPNGKVLIVGGSDSLEYRTLIELIDPVAKTVEIVGHLNQARSDHAATILANGQVLVSGGTTGLDRLTSIELIDPEKKKVEKLGDLSEGRSDHTQSLLSDGRVLVAGGSLGLSEYSPLLEIIDPATKTIGILTDFDLHVPRALHTQSVLPDGTILIVGGEGKKAQLSSIELIQVGRK